MQPVPTPPELGKTLGELAVELEMLARGHRPGVTGLDIIFTAARRLRESEAALRVLNRVWTNGLEPAAWIPAGPFKVRHDEIAAALIPLGYPDPHPATPETLRERDRPKTSGRGRGRNRGRSAGRLVKSKIGNRRGRA